MPSTVVRFATFALDPQRHVLMRDGVDVALSPHLVDILNHLVSRPGEVVTKEALLDQFWADVHVSDNTLTRAIADIRKALGDDAAKPRFIQTVARRGYRFVATTHSHTETLDVGLQPAADTEHLSGSVRADASLSSQLLTPTDLPDSTSPVGLPNHLPGPSTTHSAPLLFEDWHRGRFSLESLDASRLPAAIETFERAVAATPGYAPAHAALANACCLQYEGTRAENTPQREPLLRAIVHARRACELDPTLGEAWATLGFVLAAAAQIDEARAAVHRAVAMEPTSWRHHFRFGLAAWGEERLRACNRTLALLPEFAPVRFLSAMVFTARQAFGPALAAAAAGAATQARQVNHESAFPSVGLHWVHGLLLLHAGQLGPAILAFAREIDETQDTRIYSAEFRVNAQVGAGFAHLAANDPPGAIDAFRLALETLPRNGRALIGLYLALTKTTLAVEAPRLLTQIDRAVAELRRGERFAEAAVVQAAAQTARGDVNAACATLQRLLDVAPPGQVGWLIPIDPAFAPLRGVEAFDAVLATLAGRAS